MEKLDHIVPPEFGLYLPPKTEGSWFLRYAIRAQYIVIFTQYLFRNYSASCLARSRKVGVILADGHGATEAVLDLDALSGLTEISLGTKDESGFRYVTRFGLSVRSISSKMLVPSRIVTFVPRHLVINESEETINIRQHYFQVRFVSFIYLLSSHKHDLFTFLSITFLFYWEG
jgi:hypothetical protein